jgi:hypothetical protein
LEEIRNIPNLGAQGTLCWSSFFGVFEIFSEKINDPFTETLNLRDIVDVNHALVVVGYEVHCC